MISFVTIWIICAVGGTLSLGKLFYDDEKNNKKKKLNTTLPLNSK